MGLTTGPRLSRRKFATGSLALLGAAALPAQAALALATEAGGEDARLRALLRDIARQEDALDPLGSIYRGGAFDLAVFRQLYTDPLNRAKRAVMQQALAGLKRIDRRKLSPERQISFDIFQSDKRQDLERFRPDVLALTAVRPFNHFGGLHIEFPSLIAKDGALSYRGEAEYRRNLGLIAAFPQVLDNAVARFRQGLDSGVLETRLTIGNMIGQLDALLAQPLDQSPFTSAVRDFPAAVPAGRRGELAEQYRLVAAEQVYPAYRRMRDFLAMEYLPAARTTVGLSAMKGGAALYRMNVLEHTTLPLEPAAIHQLGLSEVARIQREMEQVKRALDYTGELRTFFDYIRTAPRFHPKSREELAEGFARVGRAVDAQVPKFFNRVPKSKLLIQPYPAYREKYEAGGSYNQGSPDGSRPGIFFFNAYDLPSRFLTGITTLYLHEGAPGHHFQISLAQEDASLPDFQRFGGNNAYVEGWALYAETLGYDMGFYQDPMQHWGTLDDEMLRAMRLVVDTGLHSKGWSRETAIAYMLANSGMGQSDATAEVERYIAWPGQALGYKIGALTIQRLKKKAQVLLGTKFDVRAFHDQILGSGALPMPILEAKLDRWIKAQQG